MPLFMDLHYITGVTAKEVGQAHQLDLNNQDQFGCKLMTYWFDEKRGYIFCLVECEDKNALIELHKNAHGLVPNKIIKVDSSLVELFLGRIYDPEKTETKNEFEKFISETAFRTLMLVDLRYFNKPGSDKKDHFIKTINKLIEDTINKYNGKKVNQNHCEIMASFAVAGNAVKCALEIQKVFMNHEYKTARDNFDLVLGLSIGPPVDKNDVFFGDTILLCKRLCEIASGCKIILAASFKEMYEGELEEMEKEFVRVLNFPEEEFLNELMDVTENSWNDEKFNVDNFSRRIGLSKSQLYRKITSLTGVSPSEFIKEYRLKKAAEMLKRRKGNISQVAFETCFCNVSYFTKCFYKRFGIYPSDYIRETI